MKRLQTLQKMGLWTYRRINHLLSSLPRVRRHPSRPNQPHRTQPHPTPVTRPNLTYPHPRHQTVTNHTANDPLPTCVRPPTPQNDTELDSAAMWIRYTKNFISSIRGRNKNLNMLRLVVDKFLESFIDSVFHRDYRRNQSPYLVNVNFPLLKCLHDINKVLARVAH